MTMTTREKDEGGAVLDPLGVGILRDLGADDVNVIGQRVDAGAGEVAQPDERDIPDSRGSRREMRAARC